MSSATVTSHAIMSHVYLKWTLDTAMDLATSGSNQKNKVARVKANWKSPDEGTLKINIDAAFVEDLRQGATALGVRNHEGKLLRAQALWYD